MSDRSNFSWQCAKNLAALVEKNRVAWRQQHCKFVQESDQFALS